MEGWGRYDNAPPCIRLLGTGGVFRDTLKRESDSFGYINKDLEIGINKMGLINISIDKKELDKRIQQAKNLKDIASDTLWGYKEAIVNVSKEAKRQVDQELWRKNKVEKLTDLVKGLTEKDIQEFYGNKFMADSIKTYIKNNLNK